MSATQRQVKELHDRKTKLIGDKVPDRQVGMAVGWAAGMAGLDCLIACLGAHFAIARQLCAFAPGAAPSLSTLMPRGVTKPAGTEMSDKALLLQDARRRMQEREKKSVDRDACVDLFISVNASLLLPAHAFTPPPVARSSGPSRCGSWSD